MQQRETINHRYDSWPKRIIIGMHDCAFALSLSAAHSRSREPIKPPLHKHQRVPIVVNLRIYTHHISLHKRRKAKAKRDMVAILSCGPRYYIQDDCSSSWWHVIVTLESSLSVRFRRSSWTRGGRMPAFLRIVPLQATGPSR